MYAFEMTLKSNLPEKLCLSLVLLPSPHSHQAVIRIEFGTLSLHMIHMLLHRCMNCAEYLGYDDTIRQHITALYIIIMDVWSIVYHLIHMWSIQWWYQLYHYYHDDWTATLLWNEKKKMFAWIHIYISKIDVLLLLNMIERCHYNIHIIKMM